MDDNAFLTLLRNFGGTFTNNINMAKTKYDKDYNKVLKFLSIQYGWNCIKTELELRPRYAKLVNDVIKATKKLK